jgi:hypothetical protein
MNPYTKHILKEYATSILIGILVLLFVCIVIKLNLMVLDWRVRKAQEPLVQRIEALERQRLMDRMGPMTNCYIMAPAPQDWSTYVGELTITNTLR